MKELQPRIRKIAERISKAENKRVKLADFLKSVGSEVELKQKVGPDSLGNKKVVGVDGGLVKKSLHGFDCVLVRSAAVCFHYRKGGVRKVNYHPSKNPVPRPEIFEALSDLDFSYFCSLNRLRSEVETSLEAAKKYSPDFLLMDGSIVIHPSNRPSSSSPLYELYGEVIDRYRELYSYTQENDINFCGVVEDSRSTTFNKMLKEEILSELDHKMVPELKALLDKTRDTSLLFLALEVGERTRVFQYSGEEHPVLKDMEKFKDDIHSFYLKTSKMDRPIKVDFLNKKKTDDLASLLVSISGHHPSYGLPAPLIEADNVAKLPEREMDNLYSQIRSLTGEIPGMMGLRRENRPFG